MTKSNRAEEFLKNMDLSGDLAPQVSTPPAAKHAGPLKHPRSTAAAKPPTRAGLKHIGGYFDMEAVEKVAVLRARLRLDNSELIELAINDLYRKHMAKRAFGDA